MRHTDGKVYDLPVNPEDLQTTHGLAFNEIRKHSSVLDLGCATGNLIMELQKRKGCKILGIEVDEGAATVARNKGLDIKQFDLEKDFLEWRTSRKFDYILMLDIIEHLHPYPQKTLRKIYSLLKPSGKLILSTPNLAHIDVITRLIEGNFKYTDAGILDKTHLHFYSREELIELLWHVNFICESIKNIEVPVGGTEQGQDTPQFSHISRDLSPVFFANTAEVYQQFYVFTKSTQTSKLPLAKHLISLGIRPKLSPLKKTDLWNIIIRYHTSQLDQLRDALYSVAGQSYPKKEVILVGHTKDSSIVNSVNTLINSYEGILKIFHTTADPRKKRGHPLNVGLDHCNGRFISFLDYDDIYYPHFGSLLISLILNSNSNLAYGNSIRASKEKSGLHYKIVSKQKVYGEPFNPVKFVVDNRIPINTYIFDQEKFSNFRFDENLDVLEDWDFLLQLLFSGKLEPSYTDIPVSEYHVRNDKTNSPLHQYDSPDDIPTELIHARKYLPSKYIGKKFPLLYQDAFKIYPDYNMLLSENPQDSYIGFLEETINQQNIILNRFQTRKIFRFYAKLLRVLGKDW